jgi:hypothetical protein
VSAFDDAALALVNDPNLSRPVLYKPAGTGEGSSIRVILSEPGQVHGFGQTGAMVRDYTAMARQSDVPDAKRGDTLTDGSDIYTVQTVLPDESDVSVTLTLKKS